MAPPCILPAFSCHRKPHSHNVLSSSMATNCVLSALVVCDVAPSFVLLLHVCCWVVCVCSGNEIGAEGANALAPSLAKLTQLQTLDLGCEWSVCLAHCVCMHLPLCGLWIVCTSCVCNDVCCFERL